MLRRKVRKRKGFSLIELLIVIAIIGIIATIAIPLLLSARNNAINEKARNGLRTVISAEAAYFAQFGAYGTLAELGSNGYVDDRIAAGGGAANGDPHVTYAVTNPTATGYGATATATTGYVYSSDETGEITETAPAP